MHEIPTQDRLKPNSQRRSIASTLLLCEMVKLGSGKVYVRISAGPNTGQEDTKMSEITGTGFVWHELMTPDTEGAQAFYREVTGLTAPPGP